MTLGVGEFSGLFLTIYHNVMPSKGLEMLELELSLSLRGRMTLGVGAIFLVYFSHSTTMSCPLRGWGYILIGC
jgi:hypothetical protein